MDCIYEFKYGYIWNEPIAKRLFEMLLSLQEDSKYYTTYNNKLKDIKINTVDTEAIYNGTHNIKISFKDFQIKVVEGHKHYITYLDKSNDESEQYVLMNELYIIKLKMYEEHKIREGYYEMLYKIEDIVKIRDNDIAKYSILGRFSTIINDDTDKNKKMLKKLYDKAKNE